jgi:hypothetical protein
MEHRNRFSRSREHVWCEGCRINDASLRVFEKHGWVSALLSGWLWKRCGEKGDVHPRSQRWDYLLRRGHIGLLEGIMVYQGGRLQAKEIGGDLFGS